MANKKRRRRKPTAQSRKWLADLMLDIVKGVVIALLVKLLKLN